MPGLTEKPIYEALALPNEALANGGIELLRAGLIDNELYVSARRVFKDPAQWGEVLADIARRVALLYSAEDTDLTEKEIIAEIEEAFAAEMGAPVIEEAPSRRPARRKTSPARSKRKTAKRRSKRAPARRQKRITKRTKR